MATTSSLSRRSLINGIGGVALATAVGYGATACSPSGSGQTTENPNKGVVLPTHRPNTVVEPDLPGDATGVPNAYFTFPREPIAATKDIPGAGGTVTAMMPGGGV